MSLILTLYSCPVNLQILQNWEMDRLLLRSSHWRPLNLLLLCLWLLPLLRVCQGNSPLIEDLKSECQRVRSNVTVRYPGCEPSTIVVNICHGACLSSLQAIADPPYLQLHCNSCRASSFSTKKRRVDFVCNGKVESHRVFFPHAHDCGCISNSLPLSG